MGETLAAGSLPGNTKIGSPRRGLAVKSGPTLIYDIKISTPTVCLLLLREGGAVFHLTKSQPRKESVGLCTREGPVGLGVSNEPVVSHVLGRLCGGVLLEHCFGTDCSLNWNHLIAPPWKS